MDDQLDRWECESGVTLTIDGKSFPVTKCTIDYGAKSGGADAMRAAMGTGDGMYTASITADMTEKERKKLEKWLNRVMKDCK